MKKNRLYINFLQQTLRLTGFLIFFLSLIQCARSPIKSLDQAMRPADKRPAVLVDDFNYQNLGRALSDNILQLKKTLQSEPLMKFGPKVVSKSDYIIGLEYLLKTLEQDHTGRLYQQAIETHFEFYEIYGDQKWGQVFMTSYYDPVIEGSLKKTKKFNTPLYATPKDMVTIQFDEYMQRFPKFDVLRDRVFEQKSRDAILRGRLVKNPDGPDQILPFFSRKEIDVDKALENRKLEMVWVDPIDSFFLQIQGSGTVRLNNGREIKIGYAAQNGYPYVPIGRFLLDIIPREKMSMKAIENHLRSLPEEKMQEILNQNPSYVFFRKIDSKSLTYFGSEVVEGRTIATDYSYFPKGALAYLEFDKPLFENAEAEEPTAWQKTSRFVIDQDTGGAIRGPHRLDLYWGKGALAAQHAGVMKNHGTLYYLLPKDDFIVGLSDKFL